MSILRPFIPTQLTGSLHTSVAELERLLTAESAATLRRLLDVLKPPPDAPRLITVLESARDTVTAYGATLAKPSAMFRLVQQSLDGLHANAHALLGADRDACELEQPLLRRLSTYPAYALALTLGFLVDRDITKVRQAVGVEIALRLVTMETFTKDFATVLRRAVTPELFDLTKSHTDWVKTHMRTRVQAAKIFEAGGLPNPEVMACLRLFDVGARHELLRKTRYAPPRQRQAILDRRHQNSYQLKASATALCARAMLLDHTALLTIIAFCAGLSLKLTMDVPLASHIADDAWIMVLDVDEGLIKTNLDPIFPDSAEPNKNANCFRHANKIVVKPLPAFVWTSLKQLLATTPNAERLAQLLPDAKTSGRQLTISDDVSALTPSTKRFLIAAAPLAINGGIDRLTAAVLANDFAVVPSSKLYYCRVRRGEIWAASELLFEELGWSPPTPLTKGMAFGSRIVPKRPAVADWYRWMVAEVTQSSPGRHCSPSRLVAFHNSYARLCASLTVLCLAARQVRELKFTTHNLSPHASHANFLDKMVGIFPGELKVPINALLRTQLALWIAHCSALQRRLEKWPNPPPGQLITMLSAYMNGERLPLFFEIDPETLQTTPLGSGDLTSWWPESLRFSGDFGRHWWEVELRDAGVRSSRIDVLLRHLIVGLEAHCSITADRIADVAADINTVQEQVLSDLGFHAVPGLSIKG